MSKTNLVTPAERKAVEQQKQIAAGIHAPGMYAHIGFLRSSPRGRPGRLGIRFYETSDLLGQKLEHGVIWESVAVV